MPVTLKINGKSTTVDVAPDTPLLWVLRDTLDLKGTKYGCGIAQCGACTVHIDGVASRSCNRPISEMGGADVVTIEGLSTDGSASRAARLGRARRGAMRLLPGGPDHVGVLAAGAHRAADGPGHRSRDEREHLPVCHLSPHSRGDPPRGDDGGGRRKWWPPRRRG